MTTPTTSTERPPDGETNFRETPEFQAILVGLIDDQRSDRSMLEHCDKMQFVSAARCVAKRIFARDVAIKLLTEGVIARNGGAA